MRSASLTSRIDWVDYAKGWCIVLVVMMHSTLGVGDVLQGEGFLHEVVMWARPFRMPDFFLISGLFLARSIDLNWRAYLDRKVFYFLYFFIIWTLIQLVLKKTSLLLMTPDLFLREFAFAFIEPFGTLWFIYILPLMFIVTKLLRHVPPALVFVVAAAAETSIRITGWQSGCIMTDEFLTRYVYFFAGYWLAPLVFQLAKWVEENRIEAVIALLAWAIIETALIALPATLIPLELVPLYLLQPQNVAINVLAALPGLSLLAGFAGALAVISVSRLLSSLGWLKWLQYLGANSIIIYLGFFLPMAITRVLLAKLGMDHIGLKSLIVTIIAILVPLLFARLIRQTPLRYLFERPQFFQYAAPPSPQNNLNRQAA